MQWCIRLLFGNYDFHIWGIFYPSLVLGVRLLMAGNNFELPSSMLIFFLVHFANNFVMQRYKDRMTIHTDTMSVYRY